MKERLTVSLDPGLITWIDDHRGQTPRSTFLNKLLKLNATIHDARQRA